MKTRLILFTRMNAEPDSTHGQILFAHWGDSLLLDLPHEMGVEDFARKFKFARHSKFDYSVGEMGRHATLLECSGTLPTEFKIDEKTTLKLKWENFRSVAGALKDGQDRRFLQLAVQFLASGAQLDDSVIAADYDAEFLQQLQSALKTKSPSDEVSE